MAFHDDHDVNDDDSDYDDDKGEDNILPGIHVQSPQAGPWLLKLSIFSFVRFWF